MAGEEYSPFLKAAWEHFMKQPGFRAHHRSALLVHDRSKAHGSTNVKHSLEEMNLACKVLPPRSPDLMPLDYGVFGSVKQQLGRELPHGLTEPTGSWSSFEQPQSRRQWRCI
jgi:hypothetical protein